MIKKIYLLLTIIFLTNINAAELDFNKDSIDDIFWRDNNTGQNQVIMLVYTITKY